MTQPNSQGKEKYLETQAWRKGCDDLWVDARFGCAHLPIDSAYRLARRREAARNRRALRAAGAIPHPAFDGKWIWKAGMVWDADKALEVIRRSKQN